jgi:hypothetical protein
MNLEEFPKKENDGAICALDTCISSKGADFETKGEYCQECECGFAPNEFVRKNIEEINFIRMKYSQPKLT